LIGDHSCAYRADREGGGLAIKDLATGAAVPPVLPEGTNRIVEKRDTFFFGISRFRSLSWASDS
jgi:hypothetical protein